MMPQASVSSRHQRAVSSASSDGVEKSSV